MQNFMKTIINAIKSWGREQIRQSTADWNQNNSGADSYIKNRPFYEEDGVIHKLDLKYLPDNIGGTQPDWNQNDPEAKDYIKNRPFYEEAYIEQEPFDGDITFDENNLYFFDTTIDLKEDVTYTIVFDDFVGEFTSYWDDVDGTCVSLELSAGDQLWVYQRYVWINSSRSYEGETHHLKVFKGNVNIVKIEEKFLPGVALQSDLDTTNSNVSTLQSDVSTLQSDVSTLQSDINTLQSDVIAPKDYFLLKDSEDNKIYKIQIQNGNIISCIYGTLNDFTHSVNQNGQYTISDWKQTLYGVSSTEMVVPDNVIL